jgi:hypothetical protein
LKAFGDFCSPSEEQTNTVSRNQIVLNKKKEQQQALQAKKRELKAVEKGIMKRAKENGRVNRDEEMNVFAEYYK